MVSVSGENQNFYAFIWHALFLAFVSTFVDVNTVLSSFILKIGGSSIHVGIITAISIGLPMITQLLFAGFLSGRSRKKPFLLMGIYIRVFALAGMGYTLAISDSSEPMRLLIMVFLWIGLFSLSGAFAEISYTDILGKVLPLTQRKKFLIFKQFILHGLFQIHFRFNQRSDRQLSVSAVPGNDYLDIFLELGCEPF